MSYLLEIAWPSKTIHEDTRSELVLFVQFRVTSWIVPVHTEEKHEAKLSDYSELPFSGYDSSRILAFNEPRSGGRV